MGPETEKKKGARGPELRVACGSVGAEAPPQPRALSCSLQSSFPHRYAQFSPVIALYYYQHFACLAHNLLNLQQFPEKALFGKMSPSLVKERYRMIEHYLKEICKNPNLLLIPLVREFLKMPMTMDEVKGLEEEFQASSK